MRRQFIRLRPYLIGSALATILMVDLSNQWEVPIVQLPTEVHDRYISELKADAPPAELLALAEGGNVQAQYIYALRHTKYAPKELQIRPDQSVAFEWTKRAAAGKHSRAMAVLALYHLRGLGTPQDIKQALHWAQLAADRGQPMGHRVLGDIAKAKADAITPPEAEPARSRSRAEQQSLIAEAYAHYRRGADAGDRHSLRALAAGYEEGLPQMPRNYRMAIDYYTRAASRRDIESIKILTNRHEEGERTPRDLIQAYAWRLVLIELADGSADRTALQSLEERMRLPEVLAGQELALKLIRELPSEAADALARLQQER